MILLLMLACGGDVDADEDGVNAAVDCDDNDPGIGKASLAYSDLDGDGYGRDQVWAMACPDEAGWVSEGGDCDDQDPSENPGAERCDCLRGDQDAVLWYADQDGDGSGAGEAVALQCGQGTGLAADDQDCDDADPERYPGADEVWYDGVDQDCGQDNDFDADGDGYEAIEGGGLDCDDQAPDTHPGAAEVCDIEQRDEDCDGLVNASDPSAVGWSWRFPDLDLDGFGAGDSELVCAPESGFSDNDQDCRDDLGSVYPDAPEICGDGVVNDCGEQTLECGVFGENSITSDQMLTVEGSAQLGISLLGPLDIDGDGATEFLAGAPSTVDPDTSATVGAVFWVSPQATSAEMLLLGEGTFGNAGASLSAADTDGDGQVDLLVGAKSVYSADSSYQGQAYLVRGPITGQVNLQDQVTLRGRAYDSYFGSQVGVLENQALAVSSPSAQNTAGQYAGEVYLFDPDPGLEANHLDALSLISVQPSSGNFGQALLPCDFDGSGQQGLLVSAPLLSPDYGQVFWLADPSAGDRILTADDSLLRGNGQVGAALGCADFDGDGQMDLAVSAPESDEVAVLLHSQGSVQWAEAWVRLESASVYALSTPGDLDQDGSEELWLGSQYTNTAHLRYGPWEAGVWSTPQNLVDTSTGYFGWSIAGDEQGVLVSAPSLTTGALIFLPGGQGQ